MVEEIYRAKVIDIHDNGFIISGIGDNGLPYKLDIDCRDVGNFDPVKARVEIGTEYKIVNGDEIKFIKIH